MKKKQFLGVLLLILAAMIWGGSFAFQLMGADQLEPFSFCGTRMTISAAAVGLITFFSSKKASQSSGEAPVRSSTYRRNTWLGGLFCGLCLSGALLISQIGIAHTTAGKAGFITSMSIFLTPVVSRVLFRNKISRLTWFAVVLGAVGMYLLCITDGFVLSKGDTLIFCSSIFYCMHLFCCDHFASRGDAVKISVLQLSVTAILSWILAFALEHPTPEQFQAAAIPLLYCGLFAGGAGYTAQLIAQQYVDPVKTSFILSTESIFSVIFGCLLLHERVSGREFLGCAIMSVAIFLVQLPRKRMREA